MLMMLAVCLSLGKGSKISSPLVLMMLAVRCSAGKCSSPLVLMMLAVCNGAGKTSSPLVLMMSAVCHSAGNGVPPDAQDAGSCSTKEAESPSGAAVTQRQGEVGMSAVYLIQDDHGAAAVY